MKGKIPESLPACPVFASLELRYFSASLAGARSSLVEEDMITKV